MDYLQVSTVHALINEVKFTNIDPREKSTHLFTQNLQKYHLRKLVRTKMASINPLNSNTQVGFIKNGERKTMSTNALPRYCDSYLVDRRAL